MIGAHSTKYNNMKMYTEKANHSPATSAPQCHILIDQPVFFHIVMSQVPWKQTGIDRVHWRVTGHTLAGEYRKQNRPEGAGELSCMDEGQTFGPHLPLAAPMGTGGTMLGKTASCGWGELVDRNPACELPTLRAPGGWASCGLVPYGTHNTRPPRNLVIETQSGIAIGCFCTQV